MFIANTLQEFVTMKEILTPISTDHSPVLFSFSKEFNSSLNKDQDYIIEIKEFYQTLFKNREQKPRQKLKVSQSYQYSKTLWV